jgi:2-alkyl-3-oxoalkanoate reductase
MGPAAASPSCDHTYKTTSGVYHVADDEPAPVRDVLLELARVLGAKPPRRVPAWPVRLLTGEGAVDIMTRAVGISSEKIKRELGWTLRYPSWRTGFLEGLR